MKNILPASQSEDILPKDTFKSQLSEIISEWRTTINSDLNSEEDKLHIKSMTYLFNRDCFFEGIREIQSNTMSQEDEANREQKVNEILHLDSIFKNTEENKNLINDSVKLSEMFEKMYEDWIQKYIQIWPEKNQLSITEIKRIYQSIAIILELKNYI